ncbi:hypothetical protein, partial [Bordetella avium]|uniref:hypothetical protein n=1 Tax=Bordetella avium TaxID=521 RepID=UPI000579C710
MKLIILQGRDQVAREFPQLHHLFERVAIGAADGEFSASDLREMAEEGRVHIGVAQQDGRTVFAFAFEFISYPRLLVLNVIAGAGGHLGAVMAGFWEQFREFAQEAGVNCIQASCGPGMARLLRRHGFFTT